MLEATGSVVVLFCLSCYLAPVLATVIVGTAVAATVYRKVAKGIEARLSNTLRCLSRVAGQAFTNIRTVRAFAGVPPAPSTVCSWPRTPCGGDRSGSVAAPCCNGAAWTVRGRVLEGAGSWGALRGP